MSAEMARRLDSCLLQQVSWEGRIEQLKTRQYTYTRISRALLHMVLGLTAARVQSYKEAGRAPYARILGFRKESQLLDAFAQSLPHQTSGANSIKSLKDLEALSLRIQLRIQPCLDPVILIRFKNMDI